MNIDSSTTPFVIKTVTNTKQYQLILKTLTPLSSHPTLYNIGSSTLSLQRGNDIQSSVKNSKILRQTLDSEDFILRFFNNNKFYSESVCIKKSSNTKCHLSTF